MVEGIELSMFIAAAADAVFGHITDPAKLAGWWLRDAAIEPKAGGKVRGTDRGGARDFSIVEFAPSKRVLLSITLPLAGRPQQTSVLFELRKEGGGVRFRITHALPVKPPLREIDAIRDGWCDALGALKLLVETGKPGGLPG